MTVWDAYMDLTDERTKDFMICDRKGHVECLSYGSSECMKYGTEYDYAKVLMIKDANATRTRGMGIIYADFESEPITITEAFEKLIPTHSEISVDGMEPNQWFSEENISYLETYRYSGNMFHIFYNIESHSFSLKDCDEEE